MVERQLPKLNVAGSSPVFRSSLKASACRLQPGLFLRKKTDRPDTLRPGGPSVFWEGVFYSLKSSSRKVCRGGRVRGVRSRGS